MSPEKVPTCSYDHTSSTGRQTHVEPTKPKSVEEIRQEELALLSIFDSHTLKFTIIPNHKQTIRSIKKTGRIGSSGALLSSESRSTWLKKAQQTIDLAKQVLRERGKL